MYVSLLPFFLYFLTHTCVLQDYFSSEALQPPLSLTYQPALL